jgi:hypothetical protein
VDYHRQICARILKNCDEHVEQRKKVFCEFPWNVKLDFYLINSLYLDEVNLRKNKSIEIALKFNGFLRIEG